ncbi:unnamed protein product [Clavelina lepadiformis]|uniref:Uncharacterized protein n=1 Tax=Clavelina lepadiformis TaxID=159417 RepID=A0ABP0G7G2_CLALP
MNGVRLNHATSGFISRECFHWGMDNFLQRYSVDPGKSGGKFARAKLGFVCVRSHLKRLMQSLLRSSADPNRGGRVDTWTVMVDVMVFLA